VSLDQKIAAWLDEHEETSYVGGESTLCDDPDGGMLRYGKAIRSVLALHSSIPTDPNAPSGLASYWCQTCMEPTDASCPTVRAIAEVLGVAERGCTTHG
jgi:hypothetical protein